MAGDTATIVRNVEGLFQAGTTCGLTDGQLLERFASSRGADDEAAQAAFTALVDRHAGMVIRTCRRILCEDQSAEDTAQATFLVLARQPRTIHRKESVAAWLHGVAVRTASKERRAADPKEEAGGAGTASWPSARRSTRQAVITTPRGGPSCMRN